MKKLLSRLFIVFLSTATCLATIEVGLRIFNIRPKIFDLRSQYVKLSDNPILGYELDPEDPHVNSYGLRKPELNIYKNQDAFRIVAIGDSITFGCCTEPLKSGYPLYLQKLIKPPDYFNSEGKVEVINAGIVGYNTIQEAEFYQQKIKKLKPDFLILQVTMNDWMPKTFEYDDLITQQSYKDQIATKLFYDLTKKINKKMLKSFIVQHLSYILATHSSKKTVLTFLKQINFFDNKEDKHTSEEWEKTKIIEDGFKKLSSYLDQAIKNKVLVVIFPDFKDNLKYYPKNLQEEHDYIKKMAISNNFDVLDLYSCYKNDYEMNKKSFLDMDMYGGDTVHPNEYGHEVAAKCISQYLQKNHQFNSNE